MDFYKFTTIVLCILVCWLYILNGVNAKAINEEFARICRIADRNLDIITEELEELKRGAV